MMNGSRRGFLLGFRASMKQRFVPQQRGQQLERVSHICVVAGGSLDG